MVSIELIRGYQLCSGSGLDRAKLLNFLHKTYQELYPDQPLSHLALMVEQYFSNQTPLWWVEWEREKAELGGDFPIPASFSSFHSHKVGCLWLGNAIDQISGDRHAHIFLLYVDPEHRQRGIGSALVNCAENWARERGDRQIGLQVFLSNKPAVNLYQKLGYQTHSISMIKSLRNRN
ncbi:acetyltransferase [Oscillatoriales cyanobacterium USR001]|nr:acetyltransferase [Oscillatoriales cyanobacterium USR001]